MKNYFSTSLFTLLTIIVFSSCDKSETSKNDEKRIEIDKIENSENPFDDVGFIHNDFLDFFIGEVDKSKDIQRTELNRVIKKYYENNGVSYNEEEQNYFTGIYDNLKELRTIGGFCNPPRWFNLCFCLPEFCNITIFNPFLPINLLDTTNAGTNYERTIKFISEVKSLETNTLINDSLSIEQKHIALNYYAVARYSAAYWHNVMLVDKQQSLWHEYLDNQPRLCVTCDVLSGDAAGAALGGLFGGPLGAGVGAGCASVGVALDHLLQLLF